MGGGGAMTSGGAQKGAARPGSAGYTYRHGWVPVAGSGAVDKRSKAKQEAKPSAPPNPEVQPKPTRAQRAADVQVTAAQNRGTVDIAPPAAKKAAPEVSTSSRSPASSRLAGGTSKLGQVSVTAEHRAAARKMSDFRNLNPEQRERALDTVARNLALLPPGALDGWKITTGDTGQGSRGGSNAMKKTVTINPAEIDDARTNKEQGNGFKVLTADSIGGIEYTITHEMGHAIDAYGNFSRQKAIATERGFPEDMWRAPEIGRRADGTRGYVDTTPPEAANVSRYAARNNQEFRAESWVAYSLGGPDTPGSYFGEILAEAVRRRMTR
jgi:hypothetical protein